MQNNIKKISVIVAIYNIEDYVSECISSIINQTYTNLEIILVDDGSTDSSGKICDNFQKKDDRIAVIHKKNGGLSDARNAGIKECSGDYITFIDGDDFVSPIMYETMIKLLNNKDNQIIVCAPAFNNQDLINDISQTKQKCITENSDNAIKYIFNDYICGNYAWNKIYSSSLFDGIKYPKGKYFEDIYVTYKLFLKANWITLINDKLIFHRSRKNQITSPENVSFQLIKDHIGAYLNLYKDQKMLKHKNIVCKNMLDCLKRCKRLTIQNKVIDADKKEVIKYINKYIRKYCKKEYLNSSNYLQSRILLIFNHIAILYLLSKAKRLISN